MLIPENSLLRRPPADLSRKQVLMLDAIRYAAEMANIAYERLSSHLQKLAESGVNSSPSDGAHAMLDAWSIVDSVHRFRKFLELFPGLSNSTWKRLLMDRTADIADLRDCVQHQEGEIADLISDGGQIWGYLSWAEIQKGRYTGKWLMLPAGSVFVGDEFLFIGPVELQLPVPPGRVRLNAFGKQVYLGRSVWAVASAVNSFAVEIEARAIRPVGPPAIERRGADTVIEGWMQVLVSNSEPSQDEPIADANLTVPSNGDVST